MNKNFSHSLHGRHFHYRVLRSFLIGLLAICAALGIGMLGYHYLEEMTWMDAFANAAMILSGMGPLTPLHTESGKFFAGCYALFSGLFFILMVAIIFGPFIHRFFVKIHAESR